MAAPAPLAPAKHRLQAGSTIFSGREAEKLPEENKAEGIS